MVICEFTRRKLAPIEKFKEFFRECQDYLKTKLIQEEDENGDISWTRDKGQLDYDLEHYAFFSNFEAFCIMKGLNYKEARNIISIYSGGIHLSEINYVNQIDVDNLKKTNLEDKSNG